MSKKIFYVMCKKCGKRIRIQIDEDVEFPEENPLYTVVHAHGELGADAHAIILDIDRNLNIRSIRASDEFFLTFDI